MYDRDILQLEEPKPPSVGKNPIELAKKRRRDPFGLAVARSYADLQIPQSMSGGGLLKSLIASQNANYKCFNCTLEISCGSIIHTRNHKQRGIYLVGKKPGQYQIKCTLMCEEYQEPQIEWIDFEVIEG